MAGIKALLEMLLLEAIEQLSDIVRPDSCILDPDRQVLLIQALLQELSPTSIWRSCACDVCIVGGSAGKEVCSRWTAPRHGAIVLLVEDSLVCNELVDVWHHRHGVKKHVCAWPS